MTTERRKPGRPPSGVPPMGKRVIMMPDELWEAIQAYAVKLTRQEGKQVSTSDAARRILERSLSRMDLK